MTFADSRIDAPNAVDTALISPVLQSWPHEPALLERALTYSQLLAELVALPTEGRERNDRYVLNEWLTYLKLTFDSLVGNEFERKFTVTLNRFIDHVADKKSKKTAQNLGSRLRILQEFSEKLKVIDDLPSGLAEAIQFMLKRLNKPVTWLGSTKKYRNATDWAKGVSTPRHTANNVEALNRLEDVMGLARGVLTIRAWPTPVGQVAHLSDDIPYRRYLEVALKHKYGIPLDKMPVRLKEMIELFVEHKRQSEHLLPTGLVMMELPHIWSSDETVKMRLNALTRLFGALVLPKLPVGAREDDWAKAITYGMGLAVEDLRFTMLVDQTILLAYMKFCELRTFDREHFLHYEALIEAKQSGQFPPSKLNMRKTLPASFEGVLALCSSLVNKPTSFLRMNPAFGAELTPPVPEDQWEAWCLVRYKQICILIEAAAGKIEFNKRSNKEVLSEVLRLEDPRETFFQIIAAMKKEFPPRTQPIWQARHWRDITILSLLNFECIRAKNVRLLDIDRHIVEKAGKLWLFIPKHELKNFIWGHADDISRQFPDDVQETLRTWITVYRPMFQGESLSRALFLNFITNPVKKPDVDPHRMTTMSIGRIIAVKTLKYLGVAVRTHAFRNVNSTSVARQGGSIAQVKACLNDSAKTATEVYLDVKNADEYKGLDDLYNKSRAKARLL